MTVYKTMDDTGLLISTVQPGWFGSNINDFAPDRVPVALVEQC